MKFKKLTYSSIIAIFSIIFVIIISLMVSKNKSEIENVKTQDIVIEEEGSIPAVATFEKLYDLLKINETNSEDNQLDIQEENEESETQKEFETIYDSYNYYALENIVYIEYNNKIISKIGFESTAEEKNTINNIIIDGNEIIIIYTKEELNAEKYDYTKIEFYNIKYKRKPKFERELKIDGTYLNLKRIENFVYILTTDFINNKQYEGLRIEDLEENIFKPKYADSNISDEDLYIDFDSIFYFEEDKYESYLNILGFDINGENKSFASSYLGAGNEIKLFNTGLYIVKTTYDYKDSAIYGFYNNLNITSHIYKLDYNKTDIEYSYFAKIDGDIFQSIVELNNYIIAITENYTTWESTSKDKNIYILDKELNIINQLLKLLPDENISEFEVINNEIIITMESGNIEKHIIEFSEDKNPQII